MQYSGVASPILAAADFMDAKVQPIAPPYSDQQTPSPICGATLGMNSNQNPSALSLSQGDTFTRLFPAQRAGRRMVTRGRMPHIKHRKNRKNSRKSLKQRGGAAAYPDSFDSRLPADLVGESRTSPLDKALADLPQFAGTYGLQTGGSRRADRKSRKASRKNRKASRKNRKASRKNRKASRKSRKSRKNRKASRKNRKASRKQRGGAYGDEAMSVADSSKLLLSPEMERFAFVNPQFYNENIVNPNFVAPYSAYIDSQK
jgi:hypothetical protein